MSPNSSSGFVLEAETVGCDTKMPLMALMDDFLVLVVLNPSSRNFTIDSVESATPHTTVRLQVQFQHRVGNARAHLRLSEHYWTQRALGVQWCVSPFSYVTV